MKVAALPLGTELVIAHFTMLMYILSTLGYETHC